MSELKRGDRVLFKAGNTLGTVLTLMTYGHSAVPGAHREVAVMLDGRDHPCRLRLDEVERLIVPEPRRRLHLLPRIARYLRLATVGGERVAG